MSAIIIKQLKVPATIGCYAWEQHIKQTLLFDIELQVDISAAAEDFDLNKTVDYDDLCKRLLVFVATKPYKLLETLIVDTARWLLQDEKISKVKLKVAKPQAIKNAAEVAVCYEMDKNMF